MTKKERHIAYWKKQGKFLIDCNTDAFNEDEIEILEKYGTWFNGLCNEVLTPFTMLQEQFVLVYKGEHEPHSIYENAWCKYLGQKNVESKPGCYQDKEYLPYVDTFHNRDLVKKQKKMMFGVMRKNHREF